MNKDEYIDFLKGTLLKIENVINLLEQDKHIAAHNKILGVQQKLAGLDTEHKTELFPQMVATRGIINQLMNGRYKEAYDYVLKLKKDIINICLRLERDERDRNEQLQKETSGSDNASPSPR